MITEKDIQWIKRVEPDGGLRVMGTVSLHAYAVLTKEKAQLWRQAEGSERTREALKEDIRQRLVTRIYGELIPVVRQLCALVPGTDYRKADDLKAEFARLIGRVK
jgi:hypothetical protein